MVDRIFALLDAHRRYRLTLDDVEGDDEVAAWCAAEDALVDEILATPAETLDGLVALVGHIRGFPEWAIRDGGARWEAIIDALDASLANLRGRTGA